MEVTNDHIFKDFESIKCISRYIKKRISTIGRDSLTNLT